MYDRLERPCPYCGGHLWLDENSDSGYCDTCAISYYEGRWFWNEDYNECDDPAELERSLKELNG